MIYPFSSTQLQSLDSGTALKIKVGSKGLVKTLRLYNFTPAFWQLTNDYDIIIDTLPPWREKIVRVSDSQNYYLTSDMTAPYFSSAAVANTQYQFGYEQTNKKWMPEEIPLLSLVQVTGSLPAGTAQLGTVGLTGQGLPRYTFDQLLVDNVAITVAAGTTYFSASVNLRGLNWMAASVGNVAGTALDYSISVYSYSPLLYGIGGTNNPAIGHQSNSTVSAAGASSTNGNGLTVGAQSPTEITQAVVGNANTTDALTFSYLEVVGG